MKNLRVITFSISTVLLGYVLTAGCSTVTQGVSTPTDVSGVTQNWDKALPTAQRFVVLVAFKNDAVRDNETGLVWEQAPQTTTSTWSAARAFCLNKTVGGHKGWRLPSIPELASLVDPSVVSPGPTLPVGHPFTNILSRVYWSASTNAEAPTHTWSVGFFDGDVSPYNKLNSFQVWCVRGGMHADAY